MTVTNMNPAVLMAPNITLLPGYAAALAAGWSPNATRDVSAEQLAALRQDPERFLSDLAKGSSAR